MDYDNVNKKITVKFFENSPADEISAVVKELLESKDHKKIIEMLDCLAEADLKEEQISSAVKEIEKAYLIYDLHYLSRYLFLLYHSMGNGSMARYYLDQCVGEIEDNALYKDALKSYNLTPLYEFSDNYFRDNFAGEYTVDGSKYKYFVYSFSDEIGQNMTLLKTRHGSIIFDCGAECAVDGTVKIPVADLKGFLLATRTSKEDIKAVIISHAHLDHYGSIETFLAFGFERNRIFMSEGTKQLIKGASQLSVSLDKFRPVSEFFAANNSIKIKSFENGHILGSECYLVTFDNINVVYSGDYCLHGQRTVKGLNPALINNEPSVKENGIDCLITESTHGDKRHYLKHVDAEKVLIHFVDELPELGYKVFFPSFAIGRSQELALILNEKHTVLLDGLAIKVSHYYENLSGIVIYNKNTRYNTEENEDRVRNFDANNIIIAGSGMALTKDGTSNNYVKAFLNSGIPIAIIKTGFINAESYGNELLKDWCNANNIRLDVPLSAHASYDEIIQLIEELNPKNVVSVHGKGIACLSDGKAPVAESEVGKASATDTVSGEVEEKETADEVFERVEIADGQLRAKIDNVYKTGLQIKENALNLQRSRPFAGACKMLIKFLKPHGAYSDVCAYLSKVDDYNEFWEYVKDGVENSYCFKLIKPTDKEPEVEDVADAVAENTATDRAEAALSQGNGAAAESDGAVSSNTNQSDVMIVLLNDGNYYVSEKLHGREPYYKLLSDRAHTSNHYYTYDLALEAAKRLRNKLLICSPNCEIVDIDIKDYPPNAASKKIPQEYFYDDNGEILFGIDGRQKIFEFRADEKQYALIDKKAYIKRIEEKINYYASNGELDFDSKGREKAYRIATGCNLPGLRFEIYKARELIKSFEWDKELFSCDVTLYNAYIEALEDAMEIQKQYVFKPRHWLVHLLNLTDYEMHINPVNNNSAIGSYEIIRHTSMVNFAVQKSKDEIFLVFADKDDNYSELAKQLGLDDEQLYVIHKPITGKRKIKEIGWTIDKLMCELFELGLGNDYYKINERLIASLAALAEDTESDKEETEKVVAEVSDTKPKKPVEYVSISALNKYQHIISLLYKDCTSLKDNDLSELKGMANRCRKQEQPDWHSLFLLLGEPSEGELKTLSKNAKKQRDAVREGNYDGLYEFRTKFKGMLLTMSENIERYKKTGEFPYKATKTEEDTALNDNKGTGRELQSGEGDSDKAKASNGKKDDILDIKIEDMNFSVRTYNCLKRKKISCIRDLVAIPEKQLYKVRNLGKTGIDEIKEKLRAMNLTIS